MKHTLIAKSVVNIIIRIVLEGFFFGFIQIFNKLFQATCAPATKCKPGSKLST